MGLAELRERVWGDPALRERLWAAAERESFVAACLALAAELGLAVTEEALRQELQAGRRGWLERHLPW